MKSARAQSRAFFIVAFADHMSLFPGSEPIKVLGKKLDKFKTSKGTIQFSLDNQIPEPIIRQIIQMKLDNINKKTK